MKKPSLKVGNRIVMIRNRDKAKTGMTGIIKCVFEEEELSYGIRFDKPFHGGHDLEDRCEMGFGHWVMRSDIEPVGPLIKKKYKLSFVK